jgi:hypothetical protein
MYAVFLLPWLLLHPFHVTLTEAEWNPQSQRLECALRVDPRDLDLALSRQAEQPDFSERLTKAELRRAAESYLQKHIRLQRGDEASGRLHWVGTEADRKYRWFYFELEPPAGEGPLRMVHRVFFQVQSGQRNTVVFRSEGKKSPALVFSRSSASHDVSFP